MARQLPRYIALGKGGKYLQYVWEEGELHSRMQLSSDRLVSEDRSITKLEIVKSETSIQGLTLVHIRSCYNNKFLVLSSEVENWIVAGADEPEEDRFKWSCTLFMLGGIKNVLSLFLLAGRAVYGVQIDETEKCLIGVRNSAAAELDIANLVSLPIMPRYVVFKGDNNKYLAARHILSHKRLKFNMDSPLNSQRAHHETVILPNGNVRFRSLSYNRFWRNAGNAFIWCESNDQTAKNSDTVFQPVRLHNKGSTAVALKNIGNNKYCERNTTRGPRRLKGTLRASTTVVNPQAVLRVEEAIRQRTIYDLEFRVNDARIYDYTRFESVADSISNWSETDTEEKEVTLTYTRIRQETFTSTMSWKIRSYLDLYGQIPLLEKGEIRLEEPFVQQRTWSKTRQTTEEISSVVTIQVPPMTKTVVTMIIGRGSIDVPFSYMQRDVLLNEKIVTNRLHDGLFTGLNTELLDYTLEQEPLSEDDDEARPAILPSKL
ncbi:KAT8 regulatory NSL complex subunit 1-like protein [Bienertia sinuspersici]